MANKLEGISVSLPLTYDSVDGPYELNKNLRDVVKQNLKNLVLTSPGERVMLPDFGVGARRFLFEPNTGLVFSDLKSKITSQVTKYLPFIQLEDLIVLTSEQDASLSPNSARLILKYNIGVVNEQDTLMITQNQN